MYISERVTQFTKLRFNFRHVKLNVNFTQTVMKFSNDFNLCVSCVPAV